MHSKLTSAAFRVAALLILSGLVPAALQAQRPDVVVVEYGDAIRGDVEQLERARLQLNTDAAGNIFIEWEQVVSVSAPGTFEIELDTGARYFGSLQPGPSERRQLIIEPDRTLDVHISEIVVITPIQATFWTRLEGIIEFGLTFAKANEALNLNSRATIDYRGRGVEHRLGGSAFLQNQENTETTSRLTGLWRTFVLLDNRWIVGGNVNVERNDELNLDIRASMGPFGGRVLTQTNHVYWLAGIGVTANRERFAGDPETSTTYESLIATQFEWFLFGDHETSFTTSFSVFPNLSDWGRVRTDFSGSFRRDLILDFFVSLSGYHTFDSRPQLDTGRADYGFSFGVGYDW